jgi:hypothetical protein
MSYALKIASRNSEPNTTVEIKLSNLKTLSVNIEFTNDRDKINKCLTSDSELLWRSQLLKIIRGI